MIESGEPEVSIKIERGRWYGWQMLPGYNDAPYFSPIYVNEFVPLRTGRRDLRIRFLNALYAAGVTDFDITIRVVCRYQTYLVGKLEPGVHPPTGRTGIISLLTTEWLERFAPTVINLAVDGHGPLEDDPQVMLDRAFRRFSAQS